MDPILYGYQNIWECIEYSGGGFLKILKRGAIWVDHGREYAKVNGEYYPIRVDRAGLKTYNIPWHKANCEGWVSQSIQDVQRLPPPKKKKSMFELF